MRTDSRIVIRGTYPVYTPMDWSARAQSLADWIVGGQMNVRCEVHSKIIADDDYETESSPHEDMFADQA